MYPSIDSYKTAYLPVSGGHTLYYEECGNPEGIPVVFLHGGPGAGIHPDMRRFFSPDHYRIILFDQRGCGKSTPRAEIKNNTIDDLVEDIERLRSYLKIEKWSVMGVSWGTALALFYAIRHPGAVQLMILSGIFIPDQAGRDLLCEGLGVSDKFPEAFKQYESFIPENDCKNGLGQAYYRIICGDNQTRTYEAVARFLIWGESTIKGVLDDAQKQKIREEAPENLPLVKIYLHFSTNFYGDNLRNELLKGVAGLSSIPCAIFHGELDNNCPIENARILHTHYPGSKLNIVKGAGHAAREDKMAAAIVKYTDGLVKGDKKP